MQNRNSSYLFCLAAALLGSALAWGQDGAAPQAPRPDSVAQMEVLTRGPVHEAFAATVSFDPTPGVVIPKMPPAAIEEVPPDQRPEGAHVIWIPGYWAWDDERTDFLWVSGIWRAVPPSRQWVPGYWGKSGDGAQWTSGYWADTAASDVEYLTEPPATVELGPNVPAPSVNHTWLPGIWLWQQNRYAWRPGYWAMGQSDWNWVPPHYVWTPRGYVFVNGYYDYSVVRRGTLFAPVYFNSNVYSQGGFSYSPNVVINPAVFANHLFLRPSYGHYYYGDYYNANYALSGYSPGFSYNSNNFGYDPFYAQQRWMHRDESNWDRHIQSEFQNRRENQNARPPHTWAEQKTILANAATSNIQHSVMAAPLADVVQSKTNALRYQPVDHAERQQFTQHQQATQQLREQRQKQELQKADHISTQPKLPSKSEPDKVKLPPPTIKTKPPEHIGPEHAPPVRHETPAPDPKIVPQRRNPEVKTNTTPLDPRLPAGGSTVEPRKPNPPGKLPENQPAKPPVTRPEKPPIAKPEKTQVNPPGKTPSEINKNPKP